MRPACSFAANSASSGLSTLRTCSSISLAAFVAWSTWSAVNDAALGFLAWSKPNKMIAGVGFGFSEVEGFGFSEVEGFGFSEVEGFGFSEAVGFGFSDAGLLCSWGFCLLVMACGSFESEGGLR